MTTAGPGAAEVERQGETGAGTVLVLAVIAVVLLLLGWVGLLAGAQAARGRAQAAADLAALAGAQALRAGGDACATVSEVVRRNAAAASSCEVQASGAVRVVASVPTVVGAATAEARAGPRSARGSPL